MSNEESSALLYRRAVKSDIAFITSSWLKSFRDGGVWSRHIPNNVYYHGEHELINRLLPRCLVLVVCRKDDPDQILGYCVSEVVDTALLIHYVYVKHTFRKMRIATAMIEELKKSENFPAIMYTHRTPIVNKLIFARRDLIRDVDPEMPKHEVDTYIYNPYLAYTYLGEAPDD